MHSLAAALLLGAMGPLALFVGPNSATWDNDAYMRAGQMKADGALPADITAKTGIWWGPDGKPRAEIDDSRATLTGESGTLGRALDHDALYKAYPALRDLPADVKEPGIFDSSLSGSYHPPTPGSTDYIEIQADRDKMMEGMLHEIQHAIQQREGFSRGGIPSGVSLLGAQTDPAVHEAYRRVMGEAEARAAASRKNLTAEQRRQLSPDRSYDVPINELTR